MAKNSNNSGKEKHSGDGKLSRRQVLKGAAAVAGAAAGSGAITGFPTIWAQEIKDIELRHVGVSYSVVKAIGDQASKDLGFKVTMQNLDTSAAINRFITQPNTVDIRRPRGLAGEARHQARHSPGHRGRQRSRNSTTSCRSSPRASSTARSSRARASRPTRRCTSSPSRRHRAARRRDRVGDLPAAGLQRRLDRLPAGPDRQAGHAVEGTDRPEIQGQGRHPRRARHRHHGRRALLRERRPDQVWQQGQHDQGGDRLHDRQADRAEEGRSLPRHLDHLRPVGAADGRGRGDHPVDVVAGRRRRPRQGDPLHLCAGQQAGRQGRLSRLVQRPRPDEATSRARSSRPPTSTSTGTTPAGRAPSSAATATTARCRRPRRSS